jgi:hypothetical protein
MTETAATYFLDHCAPPDVAEQIVDLTIALQTYLAHNPDLRATDLLATALDIIDALLAQAEKQELGARATSYLLSPINSDKLSQTPERC